MSHHLAEMIDNTENEINPEKRAESQNQVADLILKIWKHRTTLGGDAYPLSKFKNIIDAVSILSPEANVWKANKIGKYESLAAETFTMLKDLYRALYFVEFVELKSVKNKQVPPSVLSDEEQKAYEILISWAEKALSFHTTDNSSSDTTEIQSTSDNMCKFIDDLCEKLNGLKSELQTKMDY